MHMTYLELLATMFVSLNLAYTILAIRRDLLSIELHKKEIDKRNLQDAAKSILGE